MFGVDIPIWIALAALGATAAGATMQYEGQQKMVSSQKRAEEIRQQQMELDATRRRREVIRQQLSARSQALATATSQGAQYGSGVEGGMAQVSGRAGVNATGINQNAELGENMFTANQGYLSGSGMSSTGQGLQSLGKAMISSEEQLTRLGGYVSGPSGGSGGSVGFDGQSGNGDFGYGG